MFEQKVQPQRAFDYSQVHAEIDVFMTKSLFFIGAFPKSGTTWLQVMLNAHPEISCSGEGHFPNHLAALLRGALNKHNALISTKNTSIFNEFEPFPIFEEPHFRYLLASSIALMLSQSEDFGAARVIGEKTPDNLVHFPLLEGLFPHAKFLQIVRDGRDCAVSAWFHNLRTNPEALLQQHGNFARFSDHVALAWTKSLEEGLRFCMARPERCLVIRYESLFNQPRDTLRTVLRFLGVDPTASVVRKCVADGAFEKVSGGRPAGVEDRTSFVRQGSPGDWRNHFTAESNQSFMAIAGAQMARLGYV